MGHIRSKSHDHAGLLIYDQKITAAEIKEAKREAPDIAHMEREIESMVERMKARREEIAGEMTTARRRLKEARIKAATPPPIYGGAGGLKDAANERLEHQERRRVRDDKN